jgi:hypothetical protein
METGSFVFIVEMAGELSTYQYDPPTTSLPI